MAKREHIYDLSQKWTSAMSVHAIEYTETEWPILEQEQWYGLLSVAIAQELVNAGFGQEFSGDESENFLCARTFIYENARKISCSMFYAIVQEIARHADTAEACIRHAALYAKCYVQANYAELLRRCDPDTLPAVPFGSDYPAHCIVACLRSGASSALATVVSPERRGPFGIQALS